jgi:hypothetical protein
MNRFFALKKMVKKPPKGRLERDVQAGVISYLETRTDFLWWRANTGAVRFGKDFVKFGLRGAPDLQGILAPTGRFIGIECKRELGGELSVFQERWAENCRRHGGLYIVARSVDDVVNGLGRPLQAHVQKVAMRQRAVRR